MATRQHDQATTIHLGAYWQAGDPGAVGAGKMWLDTSGATPILKSRNAANTGWQVVSQAGVPDQGTFTYFDGTVAAAPATPAAGKLRLYAKTGKVLAVKDDSGVETVLGVGGAGIIGSTIVKAAAQSVTSSIALADDASLQFAIAAGDVWSARWVLFCDGDAAGDFKATVVGPAGATGRISVFGPGTGASTFDNALVANQAATLGTALPAGMLGAGNVVVVYVEASVINGANAGQVKLQWAQNVSSGTATRVFDGSFVVAIKGTAV